jgi:hypothetical protein
MPLRMPFHVDALDQGLRQTSIFTRPLVPPRPASPTAAAHVTGPAGRGILVGERELDLCRRRAGNAKTGDQSAQANLFVLILLTPSLLSLLLLH